SINLSLMLSIQFRELHIRPSASSYYWYFFFNATAATRTYSLSLHDALPIWPIAHLGYFRDELVLRRRWTDEKGNADLVALCQFLDRKSTRLNSSHVKKSYAVFCLKKKILYTPIKMSSTNKSIRFYIS